MSIWDPKTAPAGVAWDAVRIPASPGVRLWMHLTSAPDTRRHLGPVVISDRSQMTYWLIPTGSHPDDWPTNCRLLSRGAWLVMPGAPNTPYAARWLHLPHNPDQLTGTVWLADALNHQETPMNTEEQHTCTPCGKVIDGVPAWIDQGDHSRGAVDVTHQDCYEQVLGMPLTYRHEGGR